MKGLIIRYYVVYVFLLALLAGIHFFMPYFNVGEDINMYISTTCIVFLLTIPVSLKLFSIKVKDNKTLKTKESKEENYKRWAVIQIYMVAIPAVISAIGYGFIRDKSTLFCYLIAFVALILCKPSSQKMEEYTMDEYDNQI